MLDKETFSEREERVLRFWKEKQIFQKTLKQREKSAPFSFYDGPPFATGLPHYGHLLAGTIKDVVGRFKTMEDYFVERRFGWDCHGLPIEQEIEKSFNLSGASSIDAFGVAHFNEECRKIVLRYVQEWEGTVERMGRWVDFSKTWKTMDTNYMESVWWTFKEIYSKGLVYEGFKVTPFSAKLGTPLSNFEAAENYKEVDDPSIVVKLRLKEKKDTFLLIWTTTPWTLPSNMAAVVNENLDYVEVESKGERYILAKEAVPKWFKEGVEAHVVSCFSGKELIGVTYEPLFPYFSDVGAFRVVHGDFVTLESGTGVVHMAPAFGEEDFFVSKKENIPLVCPVDNNGQFTSEVSDYKGLFVKDADKAIIRRLKEEKKLFYQGTIFHRYPFCWRSDTPLIYKAIKTWYVKVESIKEDLLKANSKVHWMPPHLKEGRFGKWLEGARDWAISRNRYWGTPIPIWRSEEGDIHVVGSIKELEELTGTKITDLHRHYIDGLEFVKEGKKFKRVPEVFDCWFDTGAMPYGSNHYPFENKEKTEKTFPADFIAEGLDQTRGWFYTLMIISTALFDQPAFKNVITNGIILAEDGNKMSKRLKNYPEPKHVIDKYGADAIRLYMLHSPAVKADDLRFSEKGVELILRQILIPLWNAQGFFLTYQKIYDWKPNTLGKPEDVLDRWILSQLNRLILEVKVGMDDYDLSRAVEPFVGFIDQLTNWYIRRSRRRFWSDIDSKDRREAFQTLYHVLLELSKISAPFVPFISEALYQNLKEESGKESVHLLDFPTYSEKLRDMELEKGMDALQLSVSLGHALRKEHKIKVRQPLKKVHIVCKDEKILDFLKKESHLISDELNVKQVELHHQKDDLVKLALKPNFKVLGKKVGRHMKEAQLLIENLPQETMHDLQNGKPLHVKLGGEPFTLLLEDVEIKHVAEEGRVAIQAGIITLALDTDLNEELILEGFAREIVNKINTMRRDQGFEVVDRIRVYLATSPAVTHALHTHLNYVKEEVLAEEIHHEKHPQSHAIELNGEPAEIFIEKF